MRRMKLAVCALAAVVLSTGLLAAAEKERKRGRGRRAGADLPPELKKLDLTPDQLQKIREARAPHRQKIADLQNQLEEARKAERRDIDAVLTDAQKAKLKELRAEARQKVRSKAQDRKRARTGDKKPAEKKPDEKKPEEKKPEGNK